MSTEEKILALGELLRGRLDEGRVDFALDYVSHGENPLAFETLCEYICEYEVAITTAEYAEIISINSAQGYALHDRVTSFLRTLIKP